MLYKRPYLFSYLLSEPHHCIWASINITLPHPLGCAFFLLDVNDVYTCACGGRPPLWTTAIAHDAAGPSAGTQLAGKTSRHLLGVGWATALRILAACSDLLLDTSRFFSSNLLPHQGTLFYRLRAGLIRADMLCPWVDWHSIAHCRCVCVSVCRLLWQTVSSERHVLYYKQHSGRIHQQMYVCKVPSLGQEYINVMQMM